MKTNPKFSRSNGLETPDRDQILGLVGRNVRHRGLFALLLATLLILAACGGSSSTNASTSSDLSSLSAPTVAGGQIDFASLEGKDTVLWFWAPW